MSNKTINNYPHAVSIDGANDQLLIEQSNVYNQINRNTLLGITSQPLGLTDTQSPTNKTLDNTNTVTLKDTLFTLQDDGDTTKQARFQLSSITTATTRTFTLPDASGTLVTLAGTQTLTNKTLTSPTISAPTITNATLSADTITGSSVSTTGSIYGISVTTGTISSAAIGSSAITPEKLLTSTGTSWVTTTITPTKTGWSSTTKNVWQYIQMGKMVWLYFDVAGTSNSVTTNVTLPVAARSISATNLFDGTYGLALDNGAATAGPRWEIDLSTSATTCTFYTTYGGGAWTASGSKHIRGNITYEAA